MHGQQEIIDAVKTIQEVCNSNRDCDLCPFCNTRGRCGITDSTPDFWKINDTSEPWMALF